MLLPDGVYFLCTNEAMPVHIHTFTVSHGGTLIVSPLTYGTSIAFLLSSGEACTPTTRADHYRYLVVPAPAPAPGQVAPR